jgi:TonB family protein
MVGARQRQRWRAAGCRWAAWPLICGAFVFAGLPLPNPAFAQGASRKVISGPPPEYPVLAHKLNIHGIARVRLTITREGRVKNVKEVGGSPVLVAALAEAVKKWRYESAATENEAEVKFDFNEGR